MLNVKRESLLQMHLQFNTTQMTIFGTRLFYFCSPSISVAIPMRSADILMFNSSFPHCLTNYGNKDTVTFSLFTNSNVTNAHMTNQDCARALLTLESQPSTLQNHQRHISNPLFVDNSNLSLQVQLMMNDHSTPQELAPLAHQTKPVKQIMHDEQSQHSIGISSISTPTE